MAADRDAGSMRTIEREHDVQRSAARIWPPVAITPRRSSTSSAPRMPKIAPEAPRWGRSASARALRRLRRGRRRGRGGGSASCRSPARARARTSRARHVQGEVDGPQCRNAAVISRHQSPSADARRPAQGSRWRRGAVVSRSELPAPSAEPPIASSAQEDRDVQRDQGDRHRVPAREPSPVATPLGGAVDLPDALRLARVLGAAQPDGRRGHALVADRAPALRAREPGLAVGMAVAVPRLAAPPN